MKMIYFMGPMLKTKESFMFEDLYIGVRVKVLRYGTTYEQIFEIDNFMIFNEIYNKYIQRDLEISQFYGK
jgi:hypothetical protein